MKKICIILMLTGMTAFWGMAQEVHVNSDEEADFSSYQTFYWSPSVEDKQNGESDTAQIEEVEKVKKAIEEKMQSLGYTLQKDNPDLLVNFYRLVQQDTSKATSEPDFPDQGYAFWWGGDWYDRGDYWDSWDFWVNGETHWLYGNPLFERGAMANATDVKGSAFFIDIIDNEKNMLVWEGYMTNMGGESENAEEAEVDEQDVSAVLDKFPEEGKGEDQG